MLEVTTIITRQTFNNEVNYFTYAKNRQSGKWFAYIDAIIVTLSPSEISELVNTKAVALVLTQL